MPLVDTLTDTDRPEEDEPPELRDDRLRDRLREERRRYRYLLRDRRYLRRYRRFEPPEESEPLPEPEYDASPVSGLMLYLAASAAFVYMIFMNTFAFASDKYFRSSLLLSNGA